MLELRVHHLVCLQFFRGEGYGREFVQNLENVVARAGQGEEIRIVAGPDDVCRVCPHLLGERCAHKEGSDAEIRKLDREALRYLGAAEGETVSWPKVRERVWDAPPEWFAAFCAGCDWEKVCRRAGLAGQTVFER
ncbi:MAG: DUF1284 domain-containing protein [Desulfotomaculales bacterium]